MDVPGLVTAVKQEERYCKRNDSYSKILTR